MTLLARYFAFDRHGTDLKTEVMAGVTTFVTMAYIIIVNPKILEAAGMPFGPSMVATILSAFFGTLAMGVYAKRPFAIAPYMGENAFVAYTVVKVMGFSWQTALGAIFLGGLLFTLLTVLRVRAWLADAIPESLKIGFTVGVGLFLTFIGLNETGIVRLGVPGAPVHVGDFHQPSVLLAIAGILLTGILLVRRVRGALLLGILVTAAAGVAAGAATLPERWVDLPPDLSPVFLQLDIAGAMSWGFFSVILTIFVMDFVDTLGTLIALGMRAGMLDSRGNLPEIEKPMLCDALGTTIAALIGTTTTGAYIESATGIEAGGRTGLTAVVTSALFLLALFFAPVLTVIPAFAYGPALIIVGLLMFSPVGRLHFDDLSEVVPVFVIIILMSFTYNIGIGMTAGFVVFPVFKIVTGQWRAIRPGMWVLSVLSLAFFVFYPY
jgi:AGZA family xanthine/uracil permease-like MFS transporter